MGNQDWRQQGKQIADAFREGLDEIREGITEQTARHEGTIKNRIGKVSDYLDGKTEGKYADKLGRARDRVTERVERVANEGRSGKSDDSGPSSDG